MLAMPLRPGAVPLPAPVHLYALVLRTLWEGSDIRLGSTDMGMTRAWGGVRLLQWCDVPSPAPIRPPLREPGAARDPHPDLARVRPPQPGARRLGAAGHQRHARLAPAPRPRVPGLRGHAVDAAGERTAAGSGMLADEVATLCTVFEHVGVIAEPAHLSGKRRGNCVLLASAHPLPEGVDRVLRSDPVSVRLARSAQVQALRRAGRVLV